MQKPVSENKMKLADRPTDLRGTLEWLRAQGDLLETDKPVNPDLEITGLQKHLDGACPMLFNNVKGKPNLRAVTNLFGAPHIYLWGPALFSRHDVDRKQWIVFARAFRIKNNGR